MKTWVIYLVNGFRFLVKLWSEERKTKSYGVYIRGNTHEGSEGGYYGILEEISQLQYPGEDENHIFLFNYQWYDPIPNKGTRVRHLYSITKVKRSRRYVKLDSFVIAHQASQVYLFGYPSGLRDRQDWLVVIKTKP
ncbi:hypothetical protein MA16_Dca013336 [Dendrobium catenatum]|uniref:DUF4216 domain-containing protein n=1 Tax=Dendrobium catenatum TaxID=906689 RepID=A0A2I0XES5_9ASPA|nr:hypothetical protein MA16_Dca013336 [Dendrobium catenatum]